MPPTSSTMNFTNGPNSEVTSAMHISQSTESSLCLLAPTKALSSSRFGSWTRCAMFVAIFFRNVALGGLIAPMLHGRRHRRAVLQ